MTSDDVSRLDFDGGKVHTVSLREERRSGGWVRVALPYQVLTRTVKLTAIESHGVMFGGIKEMRFHGCLEKAETWGMNIHRAPLLGYCHPPRDNDIM